MLLFFYTFVQVRFDVGPKAKAVSPHRTCSVEELPAVSTIQEPSTACPAPRKTASRERTGEGQLTRFFVVTQAISRPSSLLNTASPLLLAHPPTLPLFSQCHSTHHCSVLNFVLDRDIMSHNCSTKRILVLWGKYIARILQCILSMLGADCKFCHQQQLHSLATM